MSDEAAAHWRETYQRRDVEELSWTEAVPAASLDLIREAGVASDAAIIDVGGGASRLAAELTASGYSDVTVADLSGEALARARREMGERARAVTWTEVDVLDHDFARRFDLWHDRAVFHFMVEPDARSSYLAALNRALVPGGHVVLATFGPDGPTECSGLPIHRYGANDLAATLGSRYELLSSRLIEHPTPSGKSQQFLYAHLRAGVEAARSV